jgi:hypothetical protein
MHLEILSDPQRELLPFIAQFKRNFYLAKWKDYVDLYFMLKNHFSIKEISIEAEQIFGPLFSEKLFRSQLTFHKDIDFSEPIEFMAGFETKEQEIKNFLIDKALEGF